MANTNTELRAEIKAAGLFYWQVADAIGISPYTLSVWLRKELQPKQAYIVRSAISKLQEEASQ